MRKIQDRLGQQLRQALACLLTVGAVGFAHVAAAEPTDLDALLKNPRDGLGNEIELVGFCVKGGRTGDVLGYECTTDVGVYVATDDIAPDSAKKKLADCGATRSDECRLTVRFVPHSFTTSGVIEPGKSVTVFHAKTADVSF